MMLETIVRKRGLR